MSTYHDDPERLTETLSAYLDGALDSAEREALERHLAGCASCQAQLAGLIRVGALLRALPEPALPRSFTLPETAARGGRAATRRASAWASAAQWVGGLAAALGAGLLVAGMLPAIHPLGAGLASDSRPYSGGASSGPPATRTTPSYTPQYAQSPNTVEGSPRVTQTPIPTASSGQVAPTPTPQVNVPADGVSAPLAPVGAVLLVGGGAALAAGTVTRRRSRRTARNQR